MTICMDVYDMDTASSTVDLLLDSSLLSSVYLWCSTKKCPLWDLCVFCAWMFLPWGFRQRHKDCEHSGASDSCNPQLWSRQTAQLQAATEGQRTSYSIFKNVCKSRFLGFDLFILVFVPALRHSRSVDVSGLLVLEKGMSSSHYVFAFFEFESFDFDNESWSKTLGIQ